MTDPAVTTAVTTIAVGALTGVAALTGQWLTHRTTTRQAEAARRVALRIERKEAYLEFLEAVQEVSHVIERRRDADPFDHDEAIRRTHRMWLLQKKIALLADPDVVAAATGLARKFNDAVWDGIAEGTDPWMYMDDAALPFLNATRADLAR